MSGLSLPIFFAFLGLVFAFNTYRYIRRGGARYYTLERENMLRRANFNLLLTTLLFLGTIGLLVISQQDGGEVEDGAQTDVLEEEATVTPATLPGVPTPGGTPSPVFIPDTPTATPFLRRGMVEGTAGSGLTLRDEPGGEQVLVLPDGSIVTILDDEPVELDGIRWIKVRTIANDEGWVAESFLVIRDR